MEAGSSSNEDQSREPCLLCGREVVSSAIVGEMYSKDGISVHQHCLYFSSGLAQKGDADSNEGISGFLIHDILAEVKRATRGNLRCSVCKRPGLFIGCSEGRSCRQGGHFPCLYEEGFLFQHCDSFSTYCPRHAPMQAPINIPNEMCCICFSSLSNKKALYCISCKTTFHRTCVQKQAWTAGMHFFRCPTCNNKEQYTNEMLRMGVALPDRDAQWETEDYFGGLLDDSKYCQAETCQCPKGRDHHTKTGKYRMRKCITCGQWIGHMHCLVGRPTECSLCANVSKKLNSKQNSQPAPLTHHMLTQSSASRVTAACPHDNTPMDNGCPVSSGCQATYTTTQTSLLAAASQEVTHHNDETNVRRSSSASCKQSKSSTRDVYRSSTGPGGRQNSSLYLTVSYSRAMIYPSYKHRSKFKRLSPRLVVHRLSSMDIESLKAKHRSSTCAEHVPRESDVVPGEAFSTPERVNVTFNERLVSSPVNCAEHIPRESDVVPGEAFSTPEQVNVTLNERLVSSPFYCAERVPRESDVVPGEAFSTPERVNVTFNERLVSSPFNCAGHVPRESDVVPEEAFSTPERVNVTFNERLVSSPVKETVNSTAKKLATRGQEEVKNQEFWVITKPSSYREFAFCFAKLSDVC